MISRSNLITYLFPLSKITVIVILVLNFFSWPFLLWAFVLFFLLFTEWLILSIFWGFLRLIFAWISSSYNSFLFRLGSIKLILSFKGFDLIFLLLFSYFLQLLLCFLKFLLFNFVISL
jgi:hypothetical protein